MKSQLNRNNKIIEIQIIISIKPGLEVLEIWENRINLKVVVMEILFFQMII
jgi:hypothetical protein